MVVSKIKTPISAPPLILPITADVTGDSIWIRLLVNDTKVRQMRIKVVF